MESYQGGVYPDSITRALVKSCITGKTHVNTDMDLRVEGRGMVMKLETSLCQKLEENTALIKFKYPNSRGIHETE